MLRGIPDTPHYAIIQERSITIPGDLRSQTNPGHGYPEHIEICISYVTYTDRAAWVAQIEALASKPFVNPWKALEVKPAKITTRISVEVAEPENNNE
ncbi:MAG TPA: hypothetical protein VNX68_01700 [Nitrosopumilaceae archaeon]|jgi:hypothetical protein|nr:hypothetical protein [Nitrosopumilaceae archaeon]